MASVAEPERHRLDLDVVPQPNAATVEALCEDPPLVAVRVAVAPDDHERAQTVRSDRRFVLATERVGVDQGLVTTG
jgi:hypothetical protein